MSKSLFDEVIGESEIDIDCPGCGISFDIQIQQIGSTVVCPHCGQKIELEESGDGLSSVESALDNFERTLNDF